MKRIKSKNYDNKNRIICNGSYRKAYEKRLKRYKSHSDRDYDINWGFALFLVVNFALIITCANFVCSRIWSCM